MKVDAPIPFARRTELNLPLFSARVQAGFPSPADDHLERSIDLNEELIQHPAATFFVRVKGESMHDAGIQSGDILVVDRSLAPTDRKIVAPLFGAPRGMAVVSFMRYGEGWLELAAAMIAAVAITWRFAREKQ